MESNTIFYFCVGMIIFLSFVFLIYYFFLKREALYVKKKNVIFPHEGQTVELKKHLATLRIEYVFMKMKIFYTGGSTRYVTLFKRGRTTFILDMSNGSLILKFHRFPTTINNLQPNIPNQMVIRTLSIIPFQKEVHLVIKQDLRNIEIIVNHSTMHTETLPFIPFVANTNGVLLADGGADYVYLKKFDYKV